MLLPFRNSLTDQHELFYQWCTMQETIEVRNVTQQYFDNIKNICITSLSILHLVLHRATTHLGGHLTSIVSTISPPSCCGLQKYLL
jgi:heme oxygenase